KDLKKQKPDASQVDKALAALEGKLSPEDLQKAKQLIDEGRADALGKLLTDKEIDRATQDRLRQLALTNGWIGRVGNGAQNGRVNLAELTALTNALRGLENALAAQTNAINLLTNALIQSLLNTARLGNNPIPRGPGTVIVIVPGIQPGLVIPLGN